MLTNGSDVKAVCAWYGLDLLVLTSGSDDLGRRFWSQLWLSTSVLVLLCFFLLLCCSVNSSHGSTFLQDNFRLERVEKKKADANESVFKTR